MDFATPFMSALSLYNWINKPSEYPAQGDQNSAQPPAQNGSGGAMGAPSPPLDLPPLPPRDQAMRLPLGIGPRQDREMDTGSQPAPGVVSPPPDVAPPPPAGNSGPNYMTSGDQGPPQYSIWDRLAAAGHGFANNGLFGGIGALGSNRANDVQNTTYDALLRSGVDPRVASAASSNPEVFNQVGPISLGAAGRPEYGPIGSDAFGNQQYGWIDKNNRSVQLPNITEQGGNGTANGIATSGVPNMLQLQQAMRTNVTGKPFYDMLDPQTQIDVKALIEGREPTSLRGNPKRRDMLMAFAARTDPNFTAQKYDQRKQALLDEGMEGKTTQAIQAANTAIDHLGNLSDMAEGLKNYGNAGLATKTLNGVQTWARDQRGDPRLSSFESLKQLAIKELEKFYVATGGTMTERQAAEAQLSASGSPDQLRGTLRTMVTAMQTRIAQKQAQHQEIFGPYAPPLQVLTPASQETIQKIWTRAKTVPLPPGTADTPFVTTQRQQPQQGAGPLPANNEVEAEMRRRGLLQ